jgi:DnaA family protein
MKQLALDIGLARAPSLATFFAGPNEAAWRHLQLWAGSPTRSPVPTYLWGPAASGKTHLLQAVQEALRELLDDVHLYTAVQQHAAFAWFVRAQTVQSAVLAAGLLPPADLKLREDLRTRLGWGHVFQLHVLSEPERRAVLRQAADARGVFLGDDVMDYILTRFSRDLDSLMQLLDHLDAYALQTQRAITIPLIRSMLENE